tara:strand:+ start:153 stop:473 length:321 start_codon:yes stop_codon:yes gene_type:complete
MKKLILLYKASVDELEMNTDNLIVGLLGIIFIGGNLFFLACAALSAFVSVAVLAIHIYNLEFERLLSDLIIILVPIGFCLISIVSKLIGVIFFTKGLKDKNRESEI